MEELQSTEVLDKEILEDARKKAFRTLKSSENIIKDASVAWEQKTQTAIKEFQKKYAEKTKQDSAEIMARLVLDKKRLRSAKIESSLQDAAFSFLDSLDKKKQLELLEKELIVRLKELADAGDPITSKDEPQVYSRLLTQEETLKLLPKEQTWSVIEPPLAFKNEGRFPAIVINTRRVKLTASLDDAIEALLQDKREELTTALFGTAEFKEEAV
ncbi:MAG: ATPase [Treponema sp.]|nr:ATPase [Treponema sp.]